MSDRTAEEWGLAAVGLPGWRWMPGMVDTEGDRWGGVTLHDGAREVLRAVNAPKQYAYEWPDRAPDPDDPATAGCLLAMLGDTVTKLGRAPHDWPELEWVGGHYHIKIGSDKRVGYTMMINRTVTASTLGRACIAAAEALGRWPGGE